MKTFDQMWDQIHRETEHGRYPSEEVIRFVARQFSRGERNAIRLLDFGCGTGAVTWFLAREGFEVHAFDGSPTAIKKASERLAHENLACHFLVADGGALPYADGLFDGIVDSAVIYANTVAGIQAILRECRRVLKPGGKLFSTGLFKIGASGYGTGQKIEEHTYREIPEGPFAHRGTVHFFDKEQINRLWPEAGFKNLVIDSLERTDHGGKYTVSFFMVQAEAK